MGRLPTVRTPRQRARRMPGLMRGAVKAAKSGPPSASAPPRQAHSRNGSQPHSVASTFALRGAPGGRARARRLATGATVVPCRRSAAGAACTRALTPFLRDIYLMCPLLRAWMRACVHTAQLKQFRRRLAARPAPPATLHNTMTALADRAWRVVKIQRQAAPPRAPPLRRRTEQFLSAGLRSTAAMRVRRRRHRPTPKPICWTPQLLNDC